MSWILTVCVFNDPVGKSITQNENTVFSNLIFIKAIIYNSLNTFLRVIIGINCSFYFVVTNSFAIIQRYAYQCIVVGKCIMPSFYSF